MLETVFDQKNNMTLLSHRIQSEGNKIKETQKYESSKKKQKETQKEITC